ncbi:beta-lactamase family protein [Gordonia rubripertincta]|uniref:serine hydrolase domain-containing protein n=1 Tax=Gordonia rubripertincta TaxID=36822 RepID=UPI00117E5F02|nr:serine hydrolase domain-containing protein [Gordonia rubripertincta]TSD94970.1 beta-lactamase family protein [Gordonia rubripertincta]
MTRRPARPIVLRILVCGVAAVLGIAACSPSQTASEGSSAIPTSVSAESGAAFQQVLYDLRSSGGFPGVIARVISPAGIWTGTAGTAVEGQDRPITASDHTRIGSLTKTMTASILLQLVQDGRVSLDDPISKYVPEAPNGNATVRQVADMTSGIPSYTLSDTFTQRFFADPGYDWPPNELVDAAKSLPPAFAPGAGWQYSNTNYVLLGLLIERVLRQPIRDAFDERIFRPLGMEDSSWPGGSVAIPDPHVNGVTSQGQPTGTTVDSTNWNPSFAFTAGAVISTLDDLQRWGDALFTGRGVLDPSTQQLRRDSILTSPPPNTATAGYGIGIGNRDGWWGHDGDFPGFNSSLFHDYDSDTTIIILVNSDDDITVDGKQESPVSAILAGLISALP